jgi:hypothetical protein
MESLNSMEKLSLLEKKIMHVCEVIKAEKALNAQLMQEKNELLGKLEQLETSLLKGAQNIEELNQEKVLTKLVVDELICSIDKLVEQEQA